MRFGLVDFQRDEEIKECLVGIQEPRIVIIKDGRVRTVPPFKESYHQVYDLLESGNWTKRASGPVQGRLSPVGLYYNYAERWAID